MNEQRLCPFTPAVLVFGVNDLQKQSISKEPDGIYSKSEQLKFT